MAGKRTAALLALVFLGSAAAQVNLNTAQFETEAAQRDQFGPEAFQFDFPAVAANTAAGSIRNMDLGSNPFLGTLPHGGLAQNEDVFSPCTINVPHVHPRGNEIYYVIDGALEWGIQQEAGATTGFSTGNLTSGQLVVVPQGLLHYVYNPSCSTTRLLQFWDNSDFGTVIQYANIVNNFPVEVLNAFTGLDASEIEVLKAAVPKPTGAITQGSICLERCGVAPTPTAGK
ncbi:hypothetical protein WJX73_006095 [Symbiochloris irregularis]|uniref:Germin-like protein n=1 Tax=Symbiochloris irregularis TaxID=706552 RepID=A0AAW1PR94_9CHLO